MEKPDFELEQLPKHIVEFLRSKVGEETSEVLEWQDLEDIFRDLEPWQNLWVFPLQH